MTRIFLFFLVVLVAVHASCSSAYAKRAHYHNLPPTRQASAGLDHFDNPEWGPCYVGRPGVYTKGIQPEPPPKQNHSHELVPGHKQNARDHTHAKHPNGHDPLQSGHDSHHEHPSEVKAHMHGTRGGKEGHEHIGDQSSHSHEEVRKTHSENHDHEKTPSHDHGLEDVSSEKQEHGRGRHSHPKKYSKIEEPHDHGKMHNHNGEHAQQPEAEKATAKSICDALTGSDHETKRSDSQASLISKVDDILTKHSCLKCHASDGHGDLRTKEFLEVLGEEKSLPILLTMPMEAKPVQKLTSDEAETIRQWAAMCLSPEETGHHHSH